MYAQYVGKKQVSIDRNLNSQALSAAMQEELKTFFRELKRARPDLKVPSQESYVRSLAVLGTFLTKRDLKKFKDASKKDLEDFIDYRKTHLMRYNYKKDCSAVIDGHASDSVMTWSKLAVKLLFRWLHTGKAGRKKLKDKDPEIIDWIEVGTSKNNNIFDTDLINDDDFKAMLKACNLPRDRLLISLLYEGGFRKGEVLNIKLKNIKNEQGRVLIQLEQSKTGPHIVPIFDSLPELKSVLSTHPYGNDPEAYLFLATYAKNGKFNPLREDSAQSAIKHIAARAKLKKHIWPHLFRHSAATRDARKAMPDELMKMKYGWSKNSGVMQRYRHLGINDLVKWELGARGTPIKDKDGHAIIKCLRCEAENPWTANFCTTCALPLTRQAIDEDSDVKLLMAEQLKRQVQEAVDAALKERKKP